jgi:hypothetical protein
VEGNDEEELCGWRSSLGIVGRVCLWLSVGSDRIRPDGSEDAAMIAAFLAGICVGVMLLAAAILLVYRWAFKHLTAEDYSNLVIEGQAFEGDKEK